MRKIMVKKSIILVLISIFFTSLNLTSLGQSQTSGNSTEVEKDKVKNLLERVGERIQKYQDAMFSIAFTEILQQQELHSDGTTKNKPKEFVYGSVVVTRTSTTN